MAKLQESEKEKEVQILKVILTGRGRALAPLLYTFYKKRTNPL